MAKPTTLKHSFPAAWLMRQSLLLLLLCLSGTAMAQMAAAKKVTPEYLHDTEIKSSPRQIWQAISDLPNVKAYSNGIISEVNVRTEQGVQYRDVTFTDGRKRTEAIEQIREEYKFFVFNIADPLPAGVTKATVTLLVESQPEKEGMAVVRWRIIMEGNKSAKKQLTDSLVAEITNYEAGLKKLLEK